MRALCYSAIVPWLLLIGFYLFLILWALNLAAEARDRFAETLCVGCAALLFWHVFFNIGMVAGILPVVGVTLPLISYGGSSLLTVLVCLGLIRVRSFSPGDLGRNHQVLTYGYDEDDAGRVTLAICDPNHHDRDDVTLSFSSSGSPDVEYAVGGRVVDPDSHEHTFGAFVQRYTHCTPSAAL